MAEKFVIIKVGEELRGREAEIFLFYEKENYNKMWGFKNKNKRSVC